MSKTDYLTLTRLERDVFIEVVNKAESDPNHLTGDAATQYVIQQAQARSGSDGSG